MTSRTDAEIIREAMTAAKAEAADELRRRIGAAREANGNQQAGDYDDLVSARSGVWLVLVWIAVVAAFVMLLGGCGGGIDTADEFMGPPAGVVIAPRPCPVDPAACQPQPTGS